MFERLKPDLYTASDAERQINKVQDPHYFFGAEKINTDTLQGQSQAYSLPPEHLTEIQKILRHAEHFHFIPFIFGQYRFKQQALRMNDISMMDAFYLPLLLAKDPSGIAVLGWRSAYFGGRKGWWRNETVVARHHLLMADHLQESEGQTEMPRQDALKEAQTTLAQSGIAPIFTSWQSIQEAGGKGEKIPQEAIKLLKTKLASPISGPRNAVIDGKNNSVGKIQNRVMRNATNWGGFGLLMALPIIAEVTTGASSAAAESLHSISRVPQEVYEKLLLTVFPYYEASMFLQAAQNKWEKGKFENEGDSNSVNSYKFPYTYNPIESVRRLQQFGKFLNEAWANIPHFRMGKSPEDIEAIKREIEEVLGQVTNSHNRDFAMHIVDDALSPLQQLSKSEYPTPLYVKGRTTPHVYLRLNEYYELPK